VRGAAAVLGTSSFIECKIILGFVRATRPEALHRCRLLYVVRVVSRLTQLYLYRGFTAIEVSVPGLLEEAQRKEEVNRVSGLVDEVLSRVRTF